MNELFLYSIRLIGMAAIVYVAILFAKTNCGRFNRIVLLLHFLGALSYLFICASYPSVNEYYRWHFGSFIVVFFLLAAMVPFLFMLMSRSFFASKVSVPIWAAALLVLQIVLELIDHLKTNCDYELTSACTGASKSIDLNTLVFVIVPSFITALFFILSMYWTLKDWKADLVEQRRQFRRGFTIMLGLFGLVMVVTEDLSLYFFPATFPLVSGIDSLLLAVFFIMLLFILLMVDTAAMVNELVAPQRSPPLEQHEPLASTQTSNPDLVQLLDFLQKGGYQQPGLNVATLADLLDIPQYRLRQLINQQLGFRNFNTFLNHHRIVDACKQLSDPTKNTLGILDIALDIGFGSITSFNDAFKKQMNTTPTAYRKTKMA